MTLEEAINAPKETCPGCGVVSSAEDKKERKGYCYDCWDELGQIAEVLEKHW